MPSSISMHRGVNFSCPGFYAACQVVQSCITLAFEKHGNLHAASAVVANDDKLTLRVELIAAQGDRVHRE